MIARPLTIRPLTALADQEAPLALFVEGMVGHYLHVKPSSQYQGQAPLSDFASQARDSIYLPEQLPSSQPSDYRVLAMQQVAMRLYGTFTFRFAHFVALYPNAGEQVTQASGLRQGETQQLRSHYRLPGLFQALYQALERLRLDQQSMFEFPGLRKHFLAYYRRAQSTAMLLDDEPDPLTQLLDHWQSQHLEMLSDTNARCSDPLLTTLYRAHASVYDSAAAADQAYKQLLATLASLGLNPTTLVQQSDMVAIEDAESSADWLERDARLTDWEQEQVGLETQMMNPLLLDPEDVDVAAVDGLDGDVRPEDASLNNVAKLPEQDPDQLKRRVDMERAALRHALGEDRSLTRSYRYDEWDYLGQRYLHHWCRLFEETLEPDSNTDGTELGKRVRPWRDEIRRRLSMIKPLGYLRQRGVEDGDELDFNAVLDSRLDAAAGLAPNDRVYSRRDRVQRDLCAAFLIDLSASTDDPMEPPVRTETDNDSDVEVNLRDPFEVDIDALEAADPNDGPRRIIDVQREAMLAMSAALESLGDEYGIFGFSGYGRDCVEYYVAKELGESFTPRTLHSIAAMKPRRSTRMGPAIRHTTKKLLASGHAMKLMIMLSDGFPQDSDYGPTRGEHEYGVQDTAKALEEAERAGIRTFCITVDRSGHDYLSRMCPSEQYLVIEEVDELPAALSKVYERLAS